MLEKQVAALQKSPVCGVQVWMDFTGSFPTSRSHTEFSASVLLNQFLTFHCKTF